jgi:RimJ/RimL family protein N-acetyltransferase
MTSMWVGRVVRLRGIEPEDWERFRSFELDSDWQRNGWQVQLPQSAEAAKAWAKERSTEKPKAGEEGFSLAIESLDEGVLVGTISTHHVALPCGRFDYGIALGPEHHRRGYASDAVRPSTSTSASRRKDGCATTTTPTGSTTTRCCSG